MIIAIEGRKYEGKTTLAFYTACELQDRLSAYKIIIFDPKWAFKSRSVLSGNKVRSIDIAEDVEELESSLDDPGTAVTFHPRIDMYRDFEQTIWVEFSNFCRAIGLEDLLRNPPQRPIILLIDEAEYLQGGRSIHPALGNAIRLATEGKLYIILACHGPRELVPMVRRQISQFYFFRLEDQADLSYVIERCGTKVAEAVERLPQHHYLFFDARTREALIYNRPDVWQVKESINGRPTQSRNENAARIA